MIQYYKIKPEASKEQANKKQKQYKMNPTTASSAKAVRQTGQRSNAMYAKKSRLQHTSAQTKWITDCEMRPVRVSSARPAKTNHHLRLPTHATCVD